MRIEGTPMGAWKKALRMVMDKGEDFEDENKRICREMFNLLIKIKNPQRGIKEPINILNNFKQWRYPPLEEIAKVMLSNKLAPDYTYSYGPRIFNFQNKIDQINNFVIPLLRRNSSSRRATISLWDPVRDSNMVKQDMPGLTMIDFKVRRDKLNVTAILRSNDLFFGWPANIYQLYVLQDFVRKKLDCETGHLYTFSVSAHVFEDQFSHIKKILDK